MSDKKIAELERELERARSQIVEVETSIGGMVPSREIAQNIIKVTVEQMHEGVQIIDHEYRYVYLNEAAAKQGAQSRWDLLGKSMLECYPQLKETEFFKRLTTVMNDRKPVQIENYFQRGDGTKSWYELFMEPHSIGVLIRSVDISDRKKLQEEYMHAQKMESIGRLAGGIAHDFNNKLGILTLYCEMAAGKLQSHPEKVHGYLQKMQLAIQQASTLTRQLLAFSRKQVLDLKVLNINDLLKTTRSTLAKLIGEDIHLDYYLDMKIPNIRVDPSQFDQVVLNLCINARDAMPKGGTLTIETQIAQLDENYCAKHSDIVPGGYVMLSVSDTGEGMSDDVKKRVFEPFFTTKPQGHGTGLGLSMVHGIVKQCMGHIWLYSEVGLGTTFKLYFPIADAPEENSDEPSNEEVDVSGTETILLVEDDPSLREAFALALQGVGYKVLIAANAEKARELYKANHEHIKLLLTDVVLPKENGRQLAEDLKKQNANIKVAFVSGYTENSIVHHGILDTESVLIQKPISVKTFLKAVRQILDGKLTKGII